MDVWLVRTLVFQERNPQYGPFHTGTLPRQQIHLRWQVHVLSAYAERTQPALLYGQPEVNESPVHLHPTVLSSDPICQTDGKWIFHRSPNCPARERRLTLFRSLEGIVLLQTVTNCGISPPGGCLKQSCVFQWTHRKGLYGYKSSVFCIENKTPYQCMLMFKICNYSVHYEAIITTNKNKSIFSCLLESTIDAHIF